MDILNSIWNSFGDKIANILPTSPFTPIVEWVRGLPYLSFVNWFVPVGEMLQLLGVWLSAIAVYYLAMVVLRWLKVVGS